MKRISKLLLLLIVVWLVGCSTTPISTSTPLSITQLKYILIIYFGGMSDQDHGILYCDPDRYPVAFGGQEQKNALEKFTQIAQDAARFQMIVRQLGLQNLAEYTDEQKLLIYRQDKQLNAFLLMPVDRGYSFDLTLIGERGDYTEVKGTISEQGAVQIASQAKLSTPGCPTCLLPDTKIDTPNGQIAVKDLILGARVWTVNRDGMRVAGAIVETVKRPVPPNYPIVHLRLKDGRELFISGNHPTADGRTMGQLLMGDRLDGSEIDLIEYVPYNGQVTYDILPSSETSFYWANGILVKSTLASSFAESR